jgi:hypothetical protein
MSDRSHRPIGRHEGALRAHSPLRRRWATAVQASADRQQPRPGYLCAPVMREPAHRTLRQDGATVVNNLFAPLTRVGRGDTIAGLATQLGRRRFLTIGRADRQNHGGGCRR